jgi:NTP pyrophosphatase (non-canonical NTP hydrolase)
MKNLINNNYDSIVKRGLITPNTNIFDFLDKLDEEVKEFKDSVVEIANTKLLKNSLFDNMNEELADIILVCLNIAKHNNIDIEKELKKKIQINYKRAAKECF